MSSVSIYDKNWIELVFEGKNQEYGAYQLRKENPKVTLLSLFYGTFFIGGVSAFFIFGNVSAPVFTAPEIINEPITVTHFTIPQPEIIQQPKAQNPVTENPVQTEPTNLSNIVVVQTQDAIQDVPTNAELTTQTVSGSGIGEGIVDATVGNSTVISGNTVEPTVNTPVKNTDLDKLPVFPGGIEKFYQYVGNNFTKPELERGTIISVIVAFVVEKDGSMTDIKVVRNPGYGLGNEAVRVLKSLKTKWTAGMKNGQKVRTEYVLPIKVRID